MSQHDTNKDICMKTAPVVILGPGMSTQDAQVPRKTANVNEGNKDNRRRQENQTRHLSATGEISAKCTHEFTKSGGRGAIGIVLFPSFPSNLIQSKGH